MDPNDPRIDERIARIKADRRLLRRYDLNENGIIDDDEWQRMRRMIAAELDLNDRRTNPNREDPPSRIGEVLHDRFEILGLLGSGGQAITWLTFDKKLETRVAVKELKLAGLDDWKAVELFEREAEALQQIDQPAVPSYVDSFHVDGRNGMTFYLAQTYVAGSNLLDELEKKRWDEDSAKDLLREVLPVLDALHRLSPPIIHRDIKPSNLMRRTDGSVSLIDFGAVQTVAQQTSGGSTIVGTHGYMPLEQYMGRAVPATDLYALGATVIHLLSRTHPSDLPFERARIYFQKRISVSTQFSDYLAKLVAPSLEDRFESAQEALEALDRLDLPVHAAASDVTVPTKGRAAILGPFISMAGFALLFPMCFYVMSKGQVLDSALSKANQCSVATEALGMNIRHTPIGCGGGESSSSGCGDSASISSDWSVPVRGNDASGQITWEAQKRPGRPVEFRVLELRSGDEYIDLNTCERIP